MIPNITGRESFDGLIVKLSQYFSKAVEAPYTFEELRTTSYSTTLRPLVRYLTDHVQHKLTIAALLALKGQYTTLETADDRGVNVARARACEVVAWRFVARLSDRDAVDYLCVELPSASRKGHDSIDANTGILQYSQHAEHTPLLSDPEAQLQNGTTDDHSDTDEDDKTFANAYEGMSALEIAAVTESKRFVAQRAVQRVIDGIWKGDIVFWDSLNPDSTKQVKFYNPKTSDPYCRLRVPLYLKSFEVLFFAAFLFFYYHVLVNKPIFSVSAAEIMLYIWLASFTYNEIGEFFDAGMKFYAADFWALWDLLIIANGFAFFATRMVGLHNADTDVIDVAFDILSVEALFLVPRICSVLSLHPYFGTLLPCLKEMTKDFMKFLSIIAILYLGFNTCFAFLARGTYSFSKMSYILVKVFFGSSYLGFDVADQISPILGPPLMLVFVCLTNILLVTSLISLLSNSLSRVYKHGRDEYLFVYAVYVLEASTSNRLTYYLPPLNLIPLILRPLRLVIRADQLRNIRISLLKALHWPFVACIIGYENSRQFLHNRQHASKMPDASSGSHTPAILRQPLVSKGPAAHASNQSLPLTESLHAAPAVHREASRSMETVQALQSLATNLQKQLDAVNVLLESEQARVRSIADRRVQVDPQAR